MLPKPEECIRFAMRHSHSRALLLLTKIYMRAIYPACDIPLTVRIGEGTRFIHRAIGVCVHYEAQIGEGCKIMQNVTIGGRNGRGAPTIGNHCFIGTGACILGDIHIGDDVMIGANAVVVRDVEDGMVVAGIPAKVIKKTPEHLLGQYKD